MITLTFLTTILTNIIILFYLKNSKIIKLINDRPDNIRKIHKKNTPSIGGIIFFINFILFFIFNEINRYFYNSYLIFNSEELSVYFFLLLLSIYTLGILDDIKDLNYKKKFFFITLIIFFFLIIEKSFSLNTINFSFTSQNIDLNKFSLPITILCILLFINAFNMFDGINMQIALYSFSLFFYLLINKIFYNLIIFTIIPLLFFMSKNYNGKIFLGNNGNILLSFFFSLIFIKSYNLGYIKYTDEIVILMLIPGLDMLRLFIERLLKKKNPFKPDKNHLHHIILDITKSQSKTVIIIMGIYIVPQILLYIGISNLMILAISILNYCFCLTVFLLIKSSKKKIL
jgi:UDP-GlcNAc:undecaprenyl-phosphate GlcNAc-1-phosphate transferase